MGCRRGGRLGLEFGGSGRWSVWAEPRAVPLIIREAALNSWPP